MALVKPGVLISFHTERNWKYRLSDLLNHIIYDQCWEGYSGNVLGYKLSYLECNK